MASRIALSAAAALALLVSFPASADTQPPTVLIGGFRNTALGTIEYHGSFSAYITAGIAPTNTEATLIAIDLNGLLASLGHHAFTAVRIIDSGQNQYGSLSPGADIDQFILTNLAPETTVSYAYDGPNILHTNETASILAQRTSLVDSFSGAQDQWNLTHVSLGNAGTLTANLSSPGGIIHNPSISSLGPQLLVSEWGLSESFRIEIVLVPAPGAVALLGFAGFLVNGSRRRRA